MNWFGHWELKAVDLNMKNVIIQWPSGLLVSSDGINNGRNLKTHMGRFAKRVRKRPEFRSESGRAAAESQAVDIEI